MTRMYHVIAINEKTNKKTYLTSYPMIHHEACVIKSKFNLHKDVRIQLEEVA